MSLLQSVREKLQFFWELCERNKTAAEKVIRADAAHLHDGLVQLEAKVVIIGVDVAKVYHAALKAVGHDVSQLEAAIGVSDTAQKNLDAQAAAQRGGHPAAAAPAPAAPVAVPAPEGAVEAAAVPAVVASPVVAPAGDPPSS